MSQDRFESAPVEAEAPKVDEPFKLFVGNLTFNTTESQVQDLFAKYPSFLEVKLADDRNTGRSKGFAFAKFSDRADAEEAVKALNGLDLDGRQIRVELSTGGPRGPRGPRRDDDRRRDFRNNRSSRDRTRDRSRERGGDRRERSRDRNDDRRGGRRDFDGRHEDRRGDRGYERRDYR